MDLTLTGLGRSYQIEANSIHGLLWLQTHFEASSWDLICSGSVRLKAESCRELRADAQAAGLLVACSPALTTT